MPTMLQVYIWLQPSSFLNLTIIPAKVLRHVRSYMGHSHPLAMAIGLWMCLEPTVAIAMGRGAPKVEAQGPNSVGIIFLCWKIIGADVCIFLLYNDYDNWINPGLNPPTSCIDVGRTVTLGRLYYVKTTPWGLPNNALRVFQGLASFGHWARLIVPGSTARQNPRFTELRGRYPKQPVKN